MIHNIDVVNIPYSEEHYIKATYPKNQLVLHHTVSNGSAKAVAEYWASTGNKEGTPYIIDRDGVIYKLFDAKFYAGHIGDVEKEMIKFSLPFRSCSKSSIGVELINMGALTMKDGKLCDAYNKLFTGEFVYYPDTYRGYEYFAKYTNAQIDALKRFILYICELFNIPTTYNEDIWTVNERALRGDAGIFCHTSYRSDKSDLHPMSELISMLKSL